MAKKPKSTASSDSKTVASADGSVSFVFTRSGRTVSARRKERTPAGWTTLEFSVCNSEEFQAVLDADPLRFQFPALYLDARRAIDELFD